MTAKSYMDVEDLEVYKECIRMLNGLEKTLERKLPEREQRWQVKEESLNYGSNGDTHSQGWPVDVCQVSAFRLLFLTPETRHLTPFFEPITE